MLRKFGPKLFCILWLISMALSIGEAFIYPGVFLRHTSINPLWIYLAMVVLGLIYRIFVRKVDDLIYKNLRRINNYLFFIISFLLVILNFLEKIHYPNYVFATFHIHPSGLIFPLILTLIVLVISYRDLKSLLKPNLLIVLLILWILISNFIEISASFRKNLYFMIHNPLSSYDIKMRRKVGTKFYDYTQFIERNTPENAKILIPPMAYPWPQTGNLAYIRYFLYPRKIVSGLEDAPNMDLKEEGIDYVLIAWGETPTAQPGFTHGWPKFDVSAERIIFLSNSNEQTEIAKNYAYEEYKNQELWGLIKVKKD